MPLSPALERFITEMPKVELHVHLEGAIAPETLLRLAGQHGVALPATSVAELRDWYTFRGFPHFVEIYLLISSCIRTADDIEMIAREFMAGQAAQNVLYSEVTYTAFTHFARKGISFADQLAALGRARRWAAEELGVGMSLIIDIPRVVSAEEGDLIADWAISGMGDGVVALGIGGTEVGNPPERYATAFERARAAGLACVPHAGETVGAESIWSALRVCHPARIEHGVTCLEDPVLVRELRERQLPLDVCPTSNVCLGVVPSMAAHPLPLLLAEGLYVTIGSDDPPMFNTTITGEYLALASELDFGEESIQQLVLNAARAALLPAAERASLVRRCVEGLAETSAPMLLEPPGV
jgi:adenosine deaminase